MKQRVVCGVCGYVMDASGKVDACPACGAAAKAFKPYVSNLSEKRDKMLENGLHPMLVHFPVSFAVFTFFFTIISALTDGVTRQLLQSTVTVLTICLPFTAVGAMLSGILDGNARFKKITTPALVKKIVFGDLFLLSSIGMILLVLLSGLQTTATLIVFLTCNLIALVSATFLGLIGKTLVRARTPG
jgi:O-antigen/teichoic acid export membrane protein